MIPVRIDIDGMPYCELRMEVSELPPEGTTVDFPSVGNVESISGRVLTVTREYGAVYPHDYPHMHPNDRDKRVILSAHLSLTTGLREFEDPEPDPPFDSDAWFVSDVEHESPEGRTGCRLPVAQTGLLCGLPEDHPGMCELEFFVTPDEHNSSEGRNACLNALNLCGSERCQLPLDHEGECKPLPDPIRDISRRAADDLPEHLRPGGAAQSAARAEAFKRSQERAEPEVTPPSLQFMFIWAHKADMAVDLPTACHVTFVIDGKGLVIPGAMAWTEASPVAWLAIADAMGATVSATNPPGPFRTLCEQRDA